MAATHWSCCIAFGRDRCIFGNLLLGWVGGGDEFASASMYFRWVWNGRARRSSRANRRSLKKRLRSERTIRRVAMVPDRVA